MFEVKKEDLKVKSVIDYPETNATAERFINVNGLTYYFFGNSKVECDEADKFEFAFGKELAETNATIDMLRNYKSFLIRQTKQPEWKKEKPETQTTNLGFKPDHILHFNWPISSHFLTVGEHDKYHKDLLRKKYLFNK